FNASPLLIGMHDNPRHDQIWLARRDSRFVHAYDAHGDLIARSAENGRLRGGLVLLRLLLLRAYFSKPISAQSRSRKADERCKVLGRRPGDFLPLNLLREEPLDKVLFDRLVLVRDPEVVYGLPHEFDVGRGIVGLWRGRLGTL